jgi:hypothetical protein
LYGKPNGYDRHGLRLSRRFNIVYFYLHGKRIDRFNDYDLYLSERQFCAERVLYLYGYAYFFD